MIASFLESYQLDYRGEENIPSVLCDGWQQFSTLVESFNRIPDAQLVFRGQRRADWKLTPGLARFSKVGVVQEVHATEQITLFRKAIRGRVSDHALFDEENPQEEDELWSIGQHYGLHTPLLDWTHSPYVALFFAFEKEDRSGESDNEYRTVYVLNKTKVEALWGNDDESAIRFIEPRKDDHGRLVSQAGLFTWSPYGKTLENALLDAIAPELADVSGDDDPKVVAMSLFKILIKNERQPEIIKYLRQMNIHPASLFPDLIGAAQNCNKLLEEKYALPLITIELSAQPIAASVEVGSPDLSLTEDLEFQPSGKVWTLLETSELVRVLTQNGLPGHDYQLLAEMITKELVPHLAQVDWQTRESAVAKMRNVTKVILRRNGYPEEARAKVIDAIIYEVQP